MRKKTKLDINDKACLHIVLIWQHPTSCPTTKSRQTTMVNALKKNFSPLPVGNDGKLTKLSTQRHQDVIEGESGLEAERVQALWALGRFISKM
jgi:hypothetical protein